ncbi:serine hydrolase-domain-containing protein [Thamnidium elegans]|nr:serine hydrolase-domain-containing protein [Thamnidium elegans]
MSVNKLKILCLHGYTQNGILYRKKTAVIRKSIEHMADLEHAMYGWWYSPDYKPVGLDGYLVGYKESLQYVKDIVKQQGPFDGILGFSQGAGFAALFTEIMETEQTPFKFSIIVAGFKPTKQTATNMMLTKENKVKTSSLHYIGDLDTLILPEKMNALLEAFEKPKIFRHTGG